MRVINQKNNHPKFILYYYLQQNIIYLGQRFSYLRNTFKKEIPVNSTTTITE